jgi:hypothetical protein
VTAKGGGIKGLMRRLKTQRQSWDDWPKRILDMAEGMRKEPGMSEEARDVVTLGKKHVTAALAFCNSDDPKALQEARMQLAKMRKAVKLGVIGGFFIGSRTLGHDHRKNLGEKLRMADKVAAKTRQHRNRERTYTYDASGEYRESEQTRYRTQCFRYLRGSLDIDDTMDMEGRRSGNYNEQADEV